MFARKKSLGQAIRDLFGIAKNQDQLLEDLEDLLLEADIGPSITMDLIAKLREQSKRQNLTDADALRRFLAADLAAKLKVVDIMPQDNQLHCYLFLGVNGVGKTTTIAKLAHRMQKLDPTRGMVLAAGDTFRAAACQQLETHGKRLGIRTVSQGAGADSAAVIFDGLQSAKSQGERVVLADTAGRLHNKIHLIKELEKVDRVVKQYVSQEHYTKILVLDATTGQNGFQQAQAFHEAVGVQGVILSKYDSSARGGMALAICQQLGLGFAFVGTGESYDDLAVFNPNSFAEAMVGL